MTRLETLLNSLFGSQYQRGSQFELIAKWYLQNEPAYKLKLRWVKLWKEWPDRWGIDAGIDLVAEDDEGALWAIQAKHYARDYWIKKSDIDKFLSESSRPQFRVRLLIGTTDHLGVTALRTMAAQEKPVHRVLRSALEQSAVRWPLTYRTLLPARAKPARPMPHQRHAVQRIAHQLKHHVRGQVVMACGTGKTLVSLWAAERIAARRTLVLVPSLALLAQTMDSWTRNARHSVSAQLC